MFQGSFKLFSMLFKRSSKGNAGKFLMYFKGICFKDVSWKLSECFKEVSQKFEGRFMED